MANIPVTVEVNKEAFELGQELGTFVVSALRAGDDGYGPDDVFTLLSELLAKVLPKIQALQAAGASTLADHDALARAISLGLIDMYEKIRAAK